MGDPISTASEAVATAQAQIKGNAEEAKTTSQPDGEAARQSATATETFVPEGVDVNSLPPALRAQVEQINKDMVRGFTEKTTKLSEAIKAETAKAVEAFRQKAEQYDALTADEEVTRAINELIQRRNAPPPNQDPVKALEEKVKTFEEKVKTSEERIQFQEQVKELESEVVAFESAVDEKTGKPLHPDFESLAGIQIGSVQRPGGKKESYSLLRFAIETAEGQTPQEKLENGYKNAKAVRDAIFEEGKKAGMGRLQQKSASASLPPSGSFAPSGTAPKKAASGLEAIQFARQGLSPAR